MKKRFLGVLVALSVALPAVSAAYSYAPYHQSYQSYWCNGYYSYTPCPVHYYPTYSYYTYSTYYEPVYYQPTYYEPVYYQPAYYQPIYYEPYYWGGYGSLSVNFGYYW